MGIWSDWYERNTGKEQALTSAEFVLKKIDEAGAGEATLSDAAESNTLPVTTKTLITTLLQTIRNNLKWLFNNKVNKSGDTMTGTLTGPVKAGNWIYAHKTNTAFHVPAQTNASSAQGVLSWRVRNGDGYAIVNLDNVSYIKYATSANIDTNTNTTSNVMWFENGNAYVNTPALPS
jgi:hypothetical protein